MFGEYRLRIVFLSGHFCGQSMVFLFNFDCDYNIICTEAVPGPRTGMNEQMIVFGLGFKKEVLQLRARECLICTVLRITVLIAPILPIHSMTLLTLMSIDLCHPHTCPSRVPAAVKASYFNVTAIKMAPVDFSLLTYFAFWCVKRISCSYLFLAVTLENLCVAHTFICLPGTWEITTTTSKIRMLPMPLVDRILQ